MLFRKNRIALAIVAAQRRLRAAHERLKDEVARQEARIVFIEVELCIDQTREKVANSRTEVEALQAKGHICFKLSLARASAYELDEGIRLAHFQPACRQILERVFAFPVLVFRRRQTRLPRRVEIA